MENSARSDLLKIIGIAIFAVIVELLFGIIGQGAPWITGSDYPFSTELFTLMIIGTLGLCIYFWRRWREVSITEHTNQQLRQSVTKAEGLHERYRSYAEAVTHGQEEERMRLARELHDDTIHRLILLSQHIELAMFDHGTSVIGGDLKKMNHLLTETIDHIRNFIQELRPNYLEELGLIPALRSLVQEKRERTGINIQFSVTGAEVRLPAATELTLYRIAQTALRNVVLHSKATEVQVLLGYTEEATYLTIVDNGVGFEVPEPSKLSQEGHFGLINMRERTSLHGGTFKIDSKPHAGTEVKIVLPNTLTKIAK